LTRVVLHQEAAGTGTERFQPPGRIGRCRGLRFQRGGHLVVALQVPVALHHVVKPLGLNLAGLRSQRIETRQRRSGLSIVVRQGRDAEEGQFPGRSLKISGDRLELPARVTQFAGLAKLDGAIEAQPGRSLRELGAQGQAHPLKSLHGFLRIGGLRIKIIHGLEASDRIERRAGVFKRARPHKKGFRIGQ
jgi:hypothetical protein